MNATQFNNYSRIKNLSEASERVLFLRDSVKRFCACSYCQEELQDEQAEFAATLSKTFSQN